MVKDLNFIHNHLDRLNVKGLPIPKKIEDIPVLNEKFSNFEELIGYLNLGFWQIMLPNHNLHINYDIVTSKSIQKVDSRIGLLAYGLIPIFITIYGVISGNYLLLLSIGVPYLTNLLSGVLNGLFGWIFILILSILGFLYWGLSIGILFGLSFFTLIVSEYIRNHRRKNTIYNCMNDEYIFCYLFYCKTISLYNQYDNEFIRHQFEN
jgi:hypothetical protein